MAKTNISVYLFQAILILLCVTCYHHALNGTFVFDDTVAIVNNKDVTGPLNLTAIFQHDFWGTPLKSVDSHKSYRPLMTIMFNYEYSNNAKPAKYMKTVNLLVHCANTLLIWHLLRDLQLPSKHQVATIAAALFAVHPVHTEAVCGIVGRADLMVCLLYLICLILAKSNVNSTLEALFDIIIIIILSIVGILFKETAITIPVACVFFRYMNRQIYLQEWSRQILWLLRPQNLLLFLATVVILCGRFWIQGFESPQFKLMDNPIALNNNTLTRILSQNFLYAVNLWIMVCPQWLCFDWAMDCIQLVHNMWDLRLQTVLAFYSLTIVAFMNYKYNHGSMLGLGLLIIPFLPASGIIKVGFVIAERVLYTPSIGFCLLVAHSFVQLHQNTKSNIALKILKCLLMLVFACFILRTRQRATDWLTEERLFNSALNVCPNNAKVHYNIARLASDKLDQNKAFHHYHKAIELYPKYEAALMNLGNLYRELGDNTKAEKYLKEALRVSPKFAAAWMNLGIVQSSKKDYKEALQSYKNALKYRKSYAVCHYNMGNMFLDQKKFSEAMHHWQEAVALNPRQAKAWANILTMLDSRGLYEDAIRLSSTALQHLPNETSLMFIRANVLGKLKHYMEAESLYKQVIEAEPLNILFHTNLGVLYHRWDKNDAAIKSYHRAIEINPEKATTARENLSKLFKRQQEEEKLKSER